MEFFTNKITNIAQSGHSASDTLYTFCSKTDLFHIKPKINSCNFLECQLMQCCIATTVKIMFAKRKFRFQIKIPKSSSLRFKVEMVFLPCSSVSKFLFQMLGTLIHEQDSLIREKIFEQQTSDSFAVNWAQIRAKYYTCFTDQFVTHWLSNEHQSFVGLPPKLRGFVCAYHLSAPSKSQLHHDFSLNIFKKPF